MTVRDPHLMTLADAARVTGKSVDTLRRWIAKGAVVPHADHGGRLYVDVRDVLPRPLTPANTSTSPQALGTRPQT